MSRLQLSNFDLQLPTNRSAHRTSDYGDERKLIVRRAQAFTCQFQFNRTVQAGDGFKIIVETGPSASVQRNTRAEMTVSSTSNAASWSAMRGRGSGNTLPITINIPANACIGNYSMVLMITSGGSTSTSNLGNFIVLFNPWAPDDAVYMSDDGERREYILNEVGQYWVGSADYFQTLKWDYGQFQPGILDICLSMLDKSVDYRRDRVADVARRNDPGYVGRVLSAMVNNIDDNGVIIGNWSGNYSGGVSPGTWNGSSAILRQWSQSGPVRYGQCWVFAGVLCTAFRCLGMPARIIINFQSAHDTSNDLQVDIYYNADGSRDTGRTSDSTWNFHAWIEGWMTRKDIGAQYDGWQVFDGTPQEPSKGIYCLGPTSVKAVKEGDVDMEYDSKFVFAEVNADTVHHVRQSDGSMKPVYTETMSVGHNTSTKAVGGFGRVDVTSNYKYDENTPKEREVMQKAKTKLRPPMAFSRMAMAREAQVEPVKPNFSGSFAKIGECQVGEDLILSLVLKNLVADPQSIKLNKKATVIVYNGTPVKDILTESESVALGPNEEKIFKITIPYNQYKKDLTPDNMIKLVAVCEDANGGSLLTETVATLKNPPLLMRPTEPIQKNKPVNVDVIFTNPIKEQVENITLILEGSWLLEKRLFVDVPCLQANQRVTISFEMYPCRSGNKCLYADFSSVKFPNVKAFSPVIVP